MDQSVANIHIQNCQIDNVDPISFVNVKKFMRITTSISLLNGKFIVLDIKTKLIANVKSKIEKKKKL